MNTFTQSIAQIIKGAMKAFQTFPMTIVNAMAFTIVTMVRIHLDWPDQEAYNFLFNCLHWSFALGAIWSLMAITAVQSRYNTAKTFAIANATGILVPLFAFLLLTFWGKAPTELASRYSVISHLAEARMVVAILVSFIGFILLAAYPKERATVASSLFMTHKSFFIAAIYGLVLMAGASGVAGAIEALLYQDMSSKVYMYIGTLAGFLAFTIFVGYFPDFRKGETDERWDIVQKQPRFVEVLFDFIMVPIALAMTAVLLLWAGRTVILSDWPNFNELSGIVTAFTIGGIWLYMMVETNDVGLPRFYRRVYPIAALVILAFSAWALFAQLGKFGLKLDEYFFIIVFVGAVLSNVLLLMRHMKAHQLILSIICALTIFSVLPLVNYKVLPLSAQVNRLEKLLMSEGILNNGQLVPAQNKPVPEVREAITDAAMYLINDYEATLPEWLDRSLSQNDVFSSKMGFEQTWPESDKIHRASDSDYLNTSLTLASGAVDISSYDWAVKPQENYDKGNTSVTVVGDKATYTVTWNMNQPSNIPSLTITQNDQVIIEQDLNVYLDQISAKYPPSNNNPVQAPLSDMSLEIETPEIKVLLVFSNIDINVNTKEDFIGYWFNLSSIYLMEK